MVCLSVQTRIREKTEKPLKKNCIMLLLFVCNQSPEKLEYDTRYTISNIWAKKKGTVKEEKALLDLRA